MGPANTSKVYVKTLEGTMSGSLSDYLVRGVRGELYICDGFIFEDTYEPYKGA